MSPAWIRRRHVTTRRNARGISYQVLWRYGGPGSKSEPAKSGGTFSTDKEARLRRDLIAGWLAQGLDPRAELAKLKRAPAVVRDYNAWADAYEASRIDHADETVKNMHSHLKRLRDIFGDRDPHALTVTDQVEAVAQLAAALKPSSVSRYWATHRLVLDFAGVDPNPARDPRVKLPTIEHEEPQPPTAAHVLTMLSRMPKRWRLALVTIEQTAMAVGETSALVWGDVDESGCRFRLRRATVKGQLRARARWVQVPEWLMEIIAAACPREDRTDARHVFQGFTPSAAGNAMARACRAAGIPVYSPHDLRHRRLSLWHGQGIPAKELAARAGHAKASMTLDTYSHVMPLDEVERTSLKEILL